MLGCASLNFLIRSLKTLSVLSSSPPPRQQNQRRGTGPPGGTVAGPVGDATAAVEALGDAVATAAGVALPPPHAPNARAATTARVESRMNGLRMSPPRAMA